MRLITLALAAALLGCSPEAPPPAAPPPAPAPVATPSAPTISDAWVRPVPPAARMTAGYLRVSNPGPGPLVIVGAESPLFGSIEMHGTDMDDGIARMRQHDTVTVEPGDTVSFEPGGLHLMLMQPINGIPASGEVDLVLLLADGERLGFSASVGQPGS